MKMARQRLCMSIALLSLLVLNCVMGSLMAPPLISKAEDSEDLLNVYGLTFGGPILSDVEKRIVDNEYIINSIKSKQSLDIQTDNLVDEYTKKQEERLKELQNDIKYYQQKNITLSNNISNNLLTLDRDSLCKLDVEYKNNIDKINEKIDIVNDFIFEYKQEEMSYDLSSYQQAIREAREERKIAINAYEVGDVSNIKFILPKKELIQGYGYHVDTADTSVIKFFPGDYYKASIGTDVKALFNGTVTSVGHSKTNGNYIVVACDNTVKYLYTHLRDILVSEGMNVRQYDVIATTGDTGQSCIMPGLFVSLYLNGVAYDVDKLF